MDSTRKSRRPRRAVLRRRKESAPPAASLIERSIVRIRGHKVLFDADLALLYGVDTRVLVQAVKRNASRFPPDFMFRLDAKEATRLRSQIVISNGRARGGRRHSPYVFTEQGVAMLSSVLRSPRAIHANIQIMRTFVRLRELMVTHAALMRKIDAMEKKYDSRFTAGFAAIRELMSPAETGRRRAIGFRTSSHRDGADTR
jgi:ORF6N domain-containing protein